MITRSLRSILALPLTDAEEQLADDHIRRECDRIQDSWSPKTRADRAAGERGLLKAPWVIPLVHVDDP